MIEIEPLRLAHALPHDRRKPAKKITYKYKGEETASNEFAKRTTRTVTEWDTVIAVSGNRCLSSLYPMTVIVSDGETTLSPNSLDDAS